MDERGHETALFSMDHGRASAAFSGRSYRIPYINFKDPDASLPKKIRMAAHALYSPIRPARHARLHGLILPRTWVISAESITICRLRFSGNSSGATFRCCIT